mgnify:CR=1 FL=1
MTARVLLCSCILSAAAQLCAQNVEVLSDPWTYGLAFRQVVLGHAPLQWVVLWPPPLSTLAEFLPAEERPPYARWFDSAAHTPGFHLAPTAGAHRFLFGVSDSLLQLLCQLSLMSRPGWVRSADTTSGFLLARLGGQALFRYRGILEGFLDISNGARLAGTPESVLQTDPSLGRILKFTIEARRYFDRYAGYLQLRWGDVRVRFGREALSLGYSPIDNLILSPQAPMLDGLLLDFTHSNLRFTYLHAAAEGTDTAGAPVPSKYIALHRLGWEPCAGLSLALYDMVVYSGRGFDFAYANPLAFFVSAGLQTAERSNRDNSLLALELALRPASRALLYGTLLVDDLNYSTLFDTSIAGNTNKFAFQLGVAGLVPIGPLGLQIATEYVRIGPFVFTHRSIVNSWTHLNAPLGYSMQPNSDRLAVQLRSWVSPRAMVTLTADYTRHGENILGPDGKLLTEWRDGVLVPIGNVGGDILRGDGDMLQPNRFLHGVRSFTRRLRIELAAEWLPNLVSVLTAEYLHRTGGNAPTRRLWGTLELRLGY